MAAARRPRSMLSAYGPPVVLGAGVGVLALAVGTWIRNGVRGGSEPGSVGDMLTRAAEVGQISGGLVPFGIATAYRESRFNPGALNTSSRENSCELYDASGGIYDGNPYGRNAFCIGAGGLYGFMPATGLKPQVFRNLNPQLIFDPKASTAMFADYVARIIKNYFPGLPTDQRTWLAIRRSMAGLSVMRDYSESGSRAREVRERLAADLATNGYNPDLMYDRPTLGNYPGAGAVWAALS